MSRRFALLAVATVLLLFPAVPAVQAQDEPDNQNNHAASFLRLGVDARIIGMGGAGSAVVDDIASVYWNPAGLAMVRGWSVTGMTSSGLNFDRTHNFVAAAYGHGPFALGASWINAGTADILAVDAGGVTTGMFDFSENAFALTAAAQAGAANAGLTVRFLNQSVGADVSGDDQALGYGVDIGAQFLATDFARVGFTVQNVFGQVGSVSEDRIRDIPSNLRFGLALEPLDRFTVATDLEKTRDDGTIWFHGGMEFGFPLSADLEGAFRLGLDRGRFAGGFGFDWSPLAVDYAYVVEREAFLDESHRFSVTFDFGGSRDIRRSSGGGDADNDGIPDDQDGCPDLPEDYDGYGDFDGCPDDDNDGDGIPDLDDDCPDEPGGADRGGCPEPESLDTDGDGIDDQVDDCPDQAETRNGYQDEDGCPDVLPVSRFETVRIEFPSGSAVLPSGPHPELDEIAAVLNEFPDLRVEIQGHTDNQGETGFNQVLSEDRALSVRAYFMRLGIAEDRLVARGYGELRPIAANGSAEGRKLNRRIEVVPLVP